MELRLVRQEPEPIPTGTGTGQTCTTMAGVHGAEVSTRQKGTTGQEGEGPVQGAGCPG